MKSTIVAALSANNVIGRDNGLPWHLSTDLKRLKALTMGHHLIMGRRTYESVGRPLPGRTTIVVTRGSYTAEGVLIAHSFEEAMRMAEERGETEAFILGGGEIFALALHRADKMELTRVHADVEGDTWFPDFDDVTEWRLTDSEHFEADAKNDYPFSFLTYVRAGATGHAIPEDEE
jgi:dihydrofolate reductase